MFPIGFHISGDGSGVQRNFLRHSYKRLKGELSSLGFGESSHGGQNCPWEKFWRCLIGWGVCQNIRRLKMRLYRTFFPAHFLNPHADILGVLSRPQNCTP